MSTKKATAKRAPAKKVTAKRATTKKATAKRATSSRAMPTRRGDLIVIDSAQVGSPPREGEILKVIQGEVSVSYRVKWADGHETIISPIAGTATIVKA